MIKATLVLSAIYLALVGIGLMIFPLQFGVGAVPEDASPQLIALLRPARNFVLSYSRHFVP